MQFNHRRRETQSEKLTVRQLLGLIRRGFFLPLSVLPFAGLLVALGDAQMRAGRGWSIVFLQAGEAVFAYWPLLLAVSLAALFAREKPGAVIFSVALAYFLLLYVSRQVHDLLAAQAGYHYELHTGWITGLAAAGLALLCQAVLAKRRMPLCLAFFSGERLLPLMTIGAALITGPLLGLSWYYLSWHTAELARRLTDLSGGGAFLYGTLSRLLMPFGLDRILDQVILIESGNYINLDGQLITGDAARFLAGDPTAGYLSAGFYPMAVLAIPVAAVVLLLTAPRGQRLPWSVYLLLLVMPAVISGLTGPFEAFLLVISPVLFLVFSLLYGLSALLAWQMQIRHGFALAPGIVDFFDQLELARHPWQLVIIGLVMAVLTLTLFYFLITRLKLGFLSGQAGTTTPRRLFSRYRKTCLQVERITEQEPDREKDKESADEL